MPTVATSQLIRNLSDCDKNLEAITVFKELRVALLRHAAFFPDSYSKRLEGTFPEMLWWLNVLNEVCQKWAAPLSRPQPSAEQSALLEDEEKFYHLLWDVIADINKNKSDYVTGRDHSVQNAFYSVTVSKPVLDMHEELSGRMRLDATGLQVAESESATYRGLIRGINVVSAATGFRAAETRSTQDEATAQLCFLEMRGILDKHALRQVSHDRARVQSLAAEVAGLSSETQRLSTSVSDLTREREAEKRRANEAEEREASLQSQLEATEAENTAFKGGEVARQGELETLREALRQAEKRYIETERVVAAKDQAHQQSVTAPIIADQDEVARALSDEWDRFCCARAEHLVTKKKLTEKRQFIDAIEFVVSNVTSRVSTILSTPTEEQQALSEASADLNADADGETPPRTPSPLSSSAGDSHLSWLLQSRSEMLAQFKVDVSRAFPDFEKSKDQSLAMQCILLGFGKAAFSMMGCAEGDHVAPGLRAAYGNEFKIFGCTILCLLINEEFGVVVNKKLMAATSTTHPRLQSEGFVAAGSNFNTTWQANVKRITDEMTLFQSHHYTQLLDLLRIETERLATKGAKKDKLDALLGRLFDLVWRILGLHSDGIQRLKVDFERETLKLPTPNASRMSSPQKTPSRGPAGGGSDGVAQAMRVLRSSTVAGQRSPTGPMSPPSALAAFASAPIGRGRARAGSDSHLPTNLGEELGEVGVAPAEAPREQGPFERLDGAFQ